MATILLAEDDRSMCAFLSAALGKAGHKVVSVYDGLRALEMLEDAPEAFDLLLTDIVMPGMDGIELSQKAGALCPSLRVMFITGFAAVVVGHQDIAPEKTRLLSKPFHLNDLVSQVQVLLEGAEKKS